MHFYLDRTLPISVGVQLRGQLEYGVAHGDIRRGSKLPSVRSLAHTLGVAPATVSQVYKELLQEGLLETIPGKGTYVTESPAAPTRDFTALHRVADELLGRAYALGYEANELAQLVQVKANSYRPAEPLELIFVGIFPEATRAYTDALRHFLRPTDRLRGITLDELARPDGRLQAEKADLVVTLGHREGAVRKLLRRVQPLTSVNFLPASEVCAALAALAPKTRLGIVATFPEFLPTMKHGVVSHAPGAEVRGGTLHSPDLPEVLAWSEVVVYATGSEAVATSAPRYVVTLEYRHTPEPHSVETKLLPLIETLRFEKSHEKRTDEHPRAELAAS